MTYLNNYPTLLPIPNPKNMNIIFKIARNELRTLYYSPVAWFLAIVFFILCAYLYLTTLTLPAIFQEQLLLNNPKWKNFGANADLTLGIFLTPGGIFTGVLQNLYLFVPLLTMGLISREVNTGTIKLLYSSPVRLREIVFGKFLAMMMYNLILLLIVGVFIVSAAFHIKSIDFGLLLSAELGFYLLVCALTAIGMFMSSLTNYQIISAISTFMLFFILSSIGNLWQKYDFIRDLTYFLSIDGRVGKMMIGLITTKDIIYFLTVIFMFLSFTLLKLKGERESKPWSLKAIRYIGVIVVSLLIGYLTSRPQFVGYWDTTAVKGNTLHVRTQQLLQKMDGAPLEVTLYCNLLGPRGQYGFPQSRNEYLSTLWDSYLRFKPDIKFNYVYYYDNDGRLDDKRMYKSFPHKTEKQIAGIVAKMNQIDESMFLEPKEIRKQIDPYSENLALYISVKYKGRTVHLRTFDDSALWPNQQQIASGLKRLVEGAVPKVYFLTGDLERNIYKTGEREYSSHSIDKNNRSALINMGFDVDTLTIEHQNIPADANVLVIADPKTTLSPVTLLKTQQYINNGGNLLVLGEPGKQGMLNPVLSQLGVQFRDGTLVQVSKNETPDKVISYFTNASFDLAEEFILSNFKKIRKEKNLEDSLKISMPGVAAIAYDTKSPFTITPLLKTSDPMVWLKTGVVVLDSVPPVFSPEDGDIRDSSFTTAIQLTRQINNKQQRIIVCSDADFKNNLRLVSDMESFGNAFYSWLNYGRYPVYVPRNPAKDVLLTITPASVDLLKTIFVWIIPGVMMLLSIVLLIRRKRK
jgi:ABC-2 type transport system permease protein